MCKHGFTILHTHLQSTEAPSSFIATQFSWNFWSNQLMHELAFPSSTLHTFLLHLLLHRGSKPPGDKNCVLQYSHLRFYIIPESYYLNPLRTKNQSSHRIRQSSKTSSPITPKPGHLFSKPLFWTTTPPSPSLTSYLFFPSSRHPPNSPPRAFSKIPFSLCPKLDNASQPLYPRPPNWSQHFRGTSTDKAGPCELVSQIGHSVWRH